MCLKLLRPVSCIFIRSQCQWTLDTCRNSWTWCAPTITDSHTYSIICIIIPTLHQVDMGVSWCILVNRVASCSQTCLVSHSVETNSITMAYGMTLKLIPHHFHDMFTRSLSISIVFSLNNYHPSWRILSYCPRDFHMVSTRGTGVYLL